MNAIRLAEKKSREGISVWLQVIWETNRLRPDTFGKPELKDWWAGGMVEEYPEARVIFVGDETVRIIGKTPEAQDAIERAAVSLGIHVRGRS